LRTFDMHIHNEKTEKKIKKEQKRGSGDFHCDESVDDRP
jgi:hypothetical protein